MNNLLRNFGGSFPKELPRNFPPKRTVNHGIDLEPGYSPPSKPPYRLSQHHLDELQTQLSALLERGFIEPSKSPFGAPVFFVRKLDGSLRLVCDWRELNRITIKNDACLPNVDDLFDAIQGSKYFTKLDLHSGYNQVRVKDGDAFDSLKSSLLCAPVLQLPDVSKPFGVHTDASDVAIAAVLEQERDSAWHPVAYTSRKLTSVETNYTIAERETLAVVFALTSWKLYLFQHFDLFTDSQAVIYLQSKRHVAKREARWMETLADFHFTLHHVQGRNS